MYVSGNQKICNTCNQVKNLTEFFRSSNGHKGRRGSCKLCCKPKKKVFTRLKMFYSAKRRSKLFNRLFNIEPGDIIIPDLCPLLEIPLIKGIGKTCSNSPTLDRIDNSKGYVKGNIWVISHKANTIKRDLTVDELQRVANNLKRKTDEITKNT